MKTLLAILYLILAPLALAERTVVLVWDASANATDYVVCVDGKPVSEVGTTQATLTIPDAKTSLTVIARNIGGESAPSDPLIIPAAPANPKGLRVQSIIRTTVSAP